MSHVNGLAHGHVLCCTGNNARAERDAAHARNAGAALKTFDLARIDAERLQCAYITTDTGSKDGANSGVYGSAYASGSGNGASFRSHRPTSARRTSRPIVLAGGGSGASVVAPGSLAATIGMRPGSAATRRTRELLNAAVASTGQFPAAQQHKPRRPGSSLQAGLVSGTDSRGNMDAAVNEEAVALPRARGLVKGSTDALLRSNARPPSAHAR